MFIIRFQAQFGDKPYRLDPNSDETMDENSIRELIREVGGNPITSGRTKAFNSKTELRIQLEHLVYRPCIGVPTALRLPSLVVGVHLLNLLPTPPFFYSGV